MQAVRIDGLVEAKEMFSRLPDALHAEVADTIEKAAEIIESEAKLRVPYEDGDLHDSIGLNIREDGLMAAVGAGAFYARFVEFGWLYAPAQPYLFPAFRWGARYVRGRMKHWPLTAAQKARARVRRGKRKNRTSGIVVPND